jgi:hypothetical protein
MSDTRALHEVIDRRVERALPARPLGRMVGRVQSVVPGLQRLQVILDDATTPVTATYPALPVTPVVGDRVAVERSRDGWMLVSHVLGRDGPEEWQGAIDDAAGIILAVDDLPAASAAYRGRVAILEGAAGVADEVHVCVKDAADAYAWEQVDLEPSRGFASIVAAVAITTTETQVVGITIPAGTLQVGSTYRATAFGVASNTSGSNQVLTLRCRVGPTTLTGPATGVRSPSIVTAAAGQGLSYEFLFTVRTTGASGTAIANGTSSSAASVPLNAVISVSNHTTTVALDTTVANILEMTAVTAHANASVTFHQALIERVM